MSFVMTFTWIGGIVIAKGFWSTFFAVIFPFWAWYLVAERVIEKFL
jgi:hypothetical protein